MMRLAADAGLDALADQLLTVPSDKGANAGGKVSARWSSGRSQVPSRSSTRRCWGTNRSPVLDSVYAPSMLGACQREF
jgi:hypothetical protein